MKPKARGAAPVARADAARRNQRLAMLALACMALGWGYNWVVMKSVLNYVGPFEFSALRNMMGALGLVGVLVTLRRPLRIRAWPRVVLLGLLQTGMFSALVQLALMHGAAGKTSILVYTMPFWLIPMAWFVFGERIRGLQWLALAMAAGGLVLILEPWRTHADSGSELLAVLGGLCWAVATMVAKWIQRDYPTEALPLTAWQMLFGSLGLTLLAWLVPERAIDPAPYFFGALVYNTVIASALAWFLWLFALQHLSAGMAGLASLGVPIVGGLAGWLQLGEQPGLMELAGMLMVGAALVVISVQGMWSKR